MGGQIFAPAISALPPSMVVYSAKSQGWWRGYACLLQTLKAFHHRGTEGTEGTEKNIVLLTAPQAQLTKKNSVSSVPLW